MPSSLPSIGRPAESSTGMGEELAELADLPAETQDGHVVSLQANIEFPGDIDDALRQGARGSASTAPSSSTSPARHEPRRRSITRPMPMPCSGLAGGRW